MLENTSQHFPAFVESETWAYSAQHHQKQLLPLHFLQLKNFLLDELFRQESQVPGAYNDFYRVMGAPKELLTNNSKVQAGLKLNETNRKNLTPHIFSTPHCQNQNPSEQKI
eukprot:2335102-Ditylum_brightwellii.AAC.1